MPSARDLSFVEIQAIDELMILRGCIRFREISFRLAYVACCQFPRVIAYANLPLTRLSEVIGAYVYLLEQRQLQKDVLAG